MKRLKGFTLVEMAVTLVAIIVLTSISVPIYKNNTTNFKQAEGYALLATIRSAQERYYAEYGRFLTAGCGSGGTNSADSQKNIFTSNENVLGINARTNKYFTEFCINATGTIIWAEENANTSRKKYCFYAIVQGEAGILKLVYNITAGTTIYGN